MIWPFSRTRTDPKSKLMFQDLTYRDPLELTRVDLGDLETSANSVWVEREAGPYPAPHTVPAFYDRTPGGITNMTFGMPAVRPAVFIATLDDVLLTGTRGLVTSDGRYCFDENFPTLDIQEMETSRLGQPEFHLNQWMGFSSTDRAGVYQLVEEKPIIEIDEPVALLSSAEGPNFGAFIYRMLPKVAALARMDKSIKILAPLYHETFRQFLIAAGIDDSRIIPHWLVDHWYRLKRVYVPSIRNRDVWFDDETIGLFDSMRMRHGCRRSDRKVYLSRKAIEGHPRKMVNEPELIDALIARGFEVILPEQMTAIDQIGIFSSAETIVSAAGSAIYNAAFCYPGARFIDIESEPHWINGHVRIFASRGLNYGVYEGLALDTSGKPHVPFNVDVPGLISRLDTF
ncbi:glycosyltransferase family 61 protein [Mesorhizobium sp. B2-8-3]|uniref:glycosyltransferase family 61 protein n=1 Tax=Mesorhizobium sp. B2-8-3 TaxID=2589905 RepID=UPI00112858B0|nr:glycosyltransferase family 61 protein [Mesorhizobium sp. B2-8-3]TPJ30639.1 glycosyltransferase family 61 protein [Mesorhizobium sp. B2-8-3]